jgi:hypothetical protein
MGRGKLSNKMNDMMHRKAMMIRPVQGIHIAAILKISAECKDSPAHCHKDYRSFSCGIFRL